MGLFSFFANADNRKSIKRLQTIVDKVNAQESRFAAMSDDELRGMTDIFRDRLRNNYETLNDILPEAFAVVREAAVSPRCAPAKERRWWQRCRPILTRWKARACISSR